MGHEVTGGIGKSDDGASLGVGYNGVILNAETESVFGNKWLAVIVGAGGQKSEVDAQIGLIDNSLGADIGLAAFNGSSKLGINLLGMSVSLEGQARIGAKFGVKVGQKTEADMGVFSLGLNFGTAK